MNYATRMPNGAIALHTVDVSRHHETGYCAQGHPLRFSVGRFGQSLQSCPCGTTPLQPYVPPPVVIDPALLPSERDVRMSYRHKVRRKCPYCDTMYLSRARMQSPTCGRMTCYRKRRRDEGRPLILPSGNPRLCKGTTGRPKKPLKNNPVREVAA